MHGALPAVQDEIAAVTSALPEPEPGAEVGEFEARLQHALDTLTMEVPSVTQRPA